MTIEYRGDYIPVEERIKLRIAKWTGLPRPEDLPVNNNIAPGNLIATRPMFEKEAETIYNIVDRVVFLSEKVGIIK